MPSARLSDGPRLREGHDAAVTEERPRARSFVRDAFRVAWRVLVWTVLLGVVAVLLAAVVVPRVGGATPYTVLTGSMQPDYPPGTLVVVRPTAIEDVAVGDVVTYQVESGDPTVVTHRVVSIGVALDGTGERTIRTQGDANDVADRDPVTADQLRGRLWYAVPYVGHASTWTSGSTRQLGASVLAAGLVVYAAWMFGSSIADRRRALSTKRRQPSGEDHA